MASKGSWSATKEAMEKQGTGTFLRLENDGDKAIVAFCDAPFHREICFNEKTKTYEAWNEETSKAAGRKKTARYAMNVFVVKDKSGAPMDMRVFDINFQTIQQVIALKEKYGFGKKLFEITRHGAKGDTKTTYQILPDDDITTEMRAVCGHQDPKNEDNWIEGTIPLHDLEEATAKGEDESTAVSDDVKKDTKKDTKKDKSAPAAGASAPTNGATNGATTNGETISKAVIAELIEKLKTVDKEKGIVPFLARFSYAKKISEVRASDETAARALTLELTGGGKAAEEDPFA
jgi:hypothetical protein